MVGEPWAPEPDAQEDRSRARRSPSASVPDVYEVCDLTGTVVEDDHGILAIQHVLDAFLDTLPTLEVEAGPWRISKRAGEIDLESPTIRGTGTGKQVGRLRRAR